MNHNQIKLSEKWFNHYDWRFGTTCCEFKPFLRIFKSRVIPKNCLISMKYTLSRERWNVKWKIHNNSQEFRSVEIPSLETQIVGPHLQARRSLGQRKSKIKTEPSINISWSDVYRWNFCHGWTISWYTTKHHFQTAVLSLTCFPNLYISFHLLLPYFFMRSFQFCVTIKNHLYGLKCQGLTLKWPCLWP